jgi:hypothetical protein
MRRGRCESRKGEKMILLYSGYRDRHTPYRWLYAQEWKVVNPSGTSVQFDTHWNGMSKEVKMVRLRSSYHFISLTRLQAAANKAHDNNAKAKGAKGAKVRYHRYHLVLLCVMLTQPPRRRSSDAATAQAKHQRTRREVESNCIISIPPVFAQ